MIKENSCIKIEYSGYTKENKILFDTTNAETAKKAGIYNEKIEYGPTTIIVGKGLVVRGLDESFIGKKEGDSYKIEVPANKAFGIKNNKLLKLIPSSYFRKNNIEPYTGLPVYIDNVPGVVRAASPGRVIVDFNHPLSSKELVYEVKIVKELTDDEEIAKTMVKQFFGEKATSSIKNGKIEVKTDKEVPKALQEAFNKTLKEILKKEHSISFVS
jgi:FKBP-type peptidyl-prolyl cis-trans isomerase 2